MALPDLSNITRREFESLLRDLASDDQTVQDVAQAALDEICYLKWQRSYMLGTEVGGHLDSQAAYLQDSVAVTCLLDALREGHPRVREFAANILWVAREKAAVPLLIDGLAAKEKEVRVAFANALGRLSDPCAVDPLIGLLGDADVDVRGVAASNLGNLGDDRAMAVLLGLLRSKNWRDRASALYGLGQLLIPLYGHAPRPAAPKAAEALPAIRCALADPHQKVRRAAKGALGTYDWHRRHFAAELSPGGRLIVQGRAVLEGVPEGFDVVADGTASGVFLRWRAGVARAMAETLLGTIPGLRRFTSLRRDEPWWMVPRVGTLLEEVAGETQWFLAERGDGLCVMVVPLFDGGMCFSLGGSAEGLMLRGETGDPAVMGDGGVAVYVAVGADPYALAAAGAEAVMRHLGTGKLRREKEVPGFVEQLGWCTWDAFYKEVSAEGVRRGLAAFAEGGVEPRVLILDDGWQDFRRMVTGEERLVSLGAGARFGGDLSATVQMAKKEFKVETFLVWHAIIGYWGGVDGGALPGYGVRDVGRGFGAGFVSRHGDIDTRCWGHMVGVIPPERIGGFYNNYHERLAAQGVDGVKVDSQAMLEGVAAGMGGRLALMRAYRGSLEESVGRHFDGRLINCMASAAEMFYESPRSVVMRTSNDFFPGDPASHGRHLYTNALVGVWFGQFMLPDWDMFQSGHAMGAFHAAGRAVSGGPVYVSDVVGGQDFGVLRKLVLSDGTVLRATDVGRPTRDCLFADVTREAVLLKIFNYNLGGAVIGVFNANHHAEVDARLVIDGTVSPGDVPELVGEEFAAYFQRGDRVWHGGREAKEAVRLAEGEWEIVTYVPVDGGVAVLGLADKYNGGAAVVEKGWAADGGYRVVLRDGGELVAWAERVPRQVEVGERAVGFTYDAATGRVLVEVAVGGLQVVVMRW